METVNIRTLPKHTIAEVLKSQALRNPDGGTYPYTPESGYLVAISDEFTDPKYLIEKYYGLFCDSEVFFGWYKHEGSDKPIFECVGRFNNLNFAKRLGIERNQYSIYDCENREEIVL